MGHYVTKRKKKLISCQNNISQFFQEIMPRIRLRSPNPTYNIPSMPDINIDDNGILKLLRDINTQKYVGPDLIPNRVLKECCAELTPILGAIFRKSLALGQLPSDWLKANVIGIYKKGQKCEPSNYRPVSLTSVTCKLMEHIISSQVMRHYTKHNFINGVQHGFLKGLSCDTLVTCHHCRRASEGPRQENTVRCHCA